MTKATFEKLGPSEQALYGPRRLVLCGFDAAARSDFLRLVQIAEIGEVECLWAGEDEAEVILKHLFEQPSDPNARTSEPAPGHPRAIIAGGLLQKDFHLLMNLSREVSMPPTLWAVLTPTSESWPLDTLLDELVAERAAIAARKSQRPQ